MFGIVETTRWVVFSAKCEIATGSQKHVAPNMVPSRMSMWAVIPGFQKSGKRMRSWKSSGEEVRMPGRISSECLEYGIFDQ